MSSPFDCPTAICGPLRQPRQMLADQVYDGHKSIHDDDMAQDLGLKAGPIEGPTHFSQFEPLLVGLWGAEWFRTGCISAHYQTMVVEGESVRAFVVPPTNGERITRIWAEKADGTPVLTGTASIGLPRSGDAPTEIEQRIAKLRPSKGLVINRELKVGQKGAAPESVCMGYDTHMGNHYPFTLRQKLAVITEPCAWFNAEATGNSPFGRPIVPTEMISVLLGSSSDLAGFRGRGPAVGLFAGQQIRYLNGPIFVDQAYDLQREIIALSESARTESVWIRTRVYEAGGEPGDRQPVAEMILNSATLKASYARYEQEARELGLLA